MTKHTDLGGSLTLPNTSIMVNRMGYGAMQLADPQVWGPPCDMAWLLHRSPNMLLIPGTSSVAHLRENLKAAALQLPPEMIADLDSVGGGRKQ